MDSKQYLRTQRHKPRRVANVTYGIVPLAVVVIILWYSAFEPVVLINERRSSNPSPLAIEKADNGGKGRGERGERGEDP